MRILWHSNGPSAPSGYGNQTYLFTQLIQADPDYNVTVSATYGREGSPAINPHGVMELPRLGDVYGNDVILSHAAFTRAHTVITLLDPFVFSPDVWKKLNWCAWTPIDSAPASYENQDALRVAKHIWSMSRFGHEQLINAGFDPVYVPHGVDTSVFRPLPDRDEAKRKLARMLNLTHDLTDKFLVITVAANKGVPSRKNFVGMIEAFARFAKTRPDAMFYLHTQVLRRDVNHEAIMKIAEAYGVADKIIYPPEYNYVTGLIGDDELNTIYNAGDVFLLLSHGEGFGIPIVEAQAAGCPVIVTDGSAMSELCMVGWRVQADLVHADALRSGTWWWQPRISDAVMALEAAYTARGDTRLREQAREKALAYDFRTVYQTYMKPALRQLEIYDPSRWSPTGLIQNGHIVYTARDPKSDAAVQVDMSTGAAKLVHGYGMTIGDITLDIEDHPEGGVAKIIAQEIQHTYGLTNLDLAPGEIVVDGGAHVGVVSIYLAKKYGVKVYAYEPIPDNFKRLTRNIETNEVGGLVIPVNMAVSGKAQTLSLAYDPTTNTGGGSGFTSGTSRISVQATTLHEIFQRHGIKQLGLLKLDCEGAEHDIIAASTALLKGVRHVVGELHSNNYLSAKGYDPVKTQRLLEQYADHVRVEICRIDDIDDNRARLSVLIPVRNGAETLERAINAALEIEGVEIVVCDDGSTDATPRILESYGTQIKVVTHAENKGQTPALVSATMAATGEFLIFHGADDWLDAEGVNRLVEHLRTRPTNIAFAYGNTRFHGARTDLYEPPAFNREQYFDSFVCHNAVIWRRSLFVESGLMWYTPDPQLAYPQDWDFALSVIERGYHGEKVDGATVLNYTLSHNGQWAKMQLEKTRVLAEMRKRWGRLRAHNV
ncbi:MAG: hypothetical protein OHK0046_48070 [Anaerolineae bacterium]